MLRLVLVLFACFRAALYSPTDLVIENLALRQQLAVPSPHRSAWMPDRCRSAVLGCVTKDVDEMVRRARLRETRDRDRMAPSQVPQALDFAPSTPAHTSYLHQRRPSRTDPSHELGS